MEHLEHKHFEWIAAKLEGRDPGPTPEASSNLVGEEHDGGDQPISETTG